MSKTSAKNKYEQLMEWLPTLASVRKRKKKKYQETDRTQKEDQYEEDGN